MIELIVLIFLCRKTTQNAGLRGQSKAGAVAYTIGLWAGMEIIGAFQAVIVMTMFNIIDQYYMLAVLWALTGAGLGGYLALLISKIQPEINSYAPGGINKQPQRNLENLHSEINGSQNKPK